MSHLRLVHSTPVPLVISHPCVEAFERELDYLHETLRRLGVKEDRLEDVAHEVFLSLHRSWSAYDPTRPLRPHLFATAYRTVCGTRPAPEREVPPPVDALDDVPELTPTSHFVSVLLDAGKIVPPQPDAIRARASARARAALTNGPAAEPEPEPRERGRGPGIRVVLPLVLAFAIGATGVALALHDRSDPLPPVSALPSPPASEPSVRDAHRGPAPAGAATPPSPSTRPRRNRVLATGKPPRSTEIECLQRAVAAFTSQDFDTALTALREHARRFPSGWLTEEREALRVRSLAGAGHTDEARAAAADFGTRFPHSVFSQSLAGPREAED